MRQETATDEPASVSTGRTRQALLVLAAFRTDLDGRLLAAGVLAIYLLTVGVPGLLWGINIWPYLGVPSAPSLFFDTRVVTSALECQRLGFDPLTSNPCDPAGRTLNYPRVWLLLRWFGLGQSHTELLAVVFIAFFLVSIYLLLGRISLGEGVLVSLALCSPSVMFGVERGNTDIVVFALLALGVTMWRTGARRNEMAGPMVVLAAAILKIFPALGLPAYLFVRRRRAAVAAVGCLAALAVYAFLFRDDLEAMARGTPQGQYNAYGARILPAIAYHYLVPDRWQGGGLTKQALAIAPLLIAAPAVWIVGRRRRPRPDPESSGWRRLAFYQGSLLFLGTFAAGNNWDYRLVFLLLLLPQLLAWIVDPSPDPRGSMAAFATVSVLVLLWIGAVSRWIVAADEVATWTTAALLLALLCASIPSRGDLGSSAEA